MSNSLCSIEVSDRKTRSGVVKEEELQIMEDSMHNNSNMDLYDQHDGDGELQYNVGWIRFGISIGTIKFVLLFLQQGYQRDIKLLEAYKSFAQLYDREHPDFR